MSEINSKIDAVLKSIREDARKNRIPAAMILEIYESGRVPFQVSGRIANVPFISYYAHPDAPED
jgi:hypothetical protein